MSTATGFTGTGNGTTVPARDVQLPGLVAIAWSLAGGMLLGGAAVAAMLATARLSGHMMLMASATLFTAGAVLGLAHGLVLSVFGRPEGMTAMGALAAVRHGALYLVPALLLGWLLAGWVASLPIAVSGRHAIAVGISIAAWVIMLATVLFAGSVGIEAARMAYRRWPDRVLGSWLVAAVLVALAVTAWARPPRIWFTDLRLTGIGSVAFVLVATFWVYGPIITAGLALLRRVRPMLPATRSVRDPRWRDATLRALLAVAAGVALALLALPFHEGVVAVPSDSERLGIGAAALLALSDAVTDELLLRMFLVTAVFALIARYRPGRHAWMVGLAVLAATLADLALHYPALPPLGLPGFAVTASYVMARMALPAVLFGYLFLHRGLGTAVAAHATSGAVLGLLAF
jgi:hypothetical protein